MRILLTNLLPPQSPGQPAIAAEPVAASSAKFARTFTPGPVFASKDDLLEVGVDGTAMAASSVSPAREEGAPLARGVAGIRQNRRSRS